MDIFKINIIGNKKLLITPYSKLVSVIIIFLLSLFSGVSNASESSPRKTVFVKQAQALVLSSQKIRSFKLKEKPVSQVSSVIIEGKKQVPQAIVQTPPATPSPQESEKKESSENKAIAKEESKSPENPYLLALNSYREKNGKSPLIWDGKLADYSQGRAELYNSIGAMDGHSGFNDFLNNQDGFKKLGFNSLGENSGYGHTSSPTSLIEDGYGKSPPHNENQLNSKWSHVGIGVKGTATNFVFGGNKN